MRGQPIEIRDITHQPATIKPAPKRSKIYVRAITGPIELLRRSIGLVLLSVFLLLPWITYSGRQAILLDFSAQRFHLFGLTLWPQDLTLLAWVFILAAFALFAVTVVFGRVWCGFMCPQTVFTFLFVWIEEKVEGARHKRMHLDKQPMSWNKVKTKALKHSLWLLIALLTAITFVGYFTPIRALVSEWYGLEFAFWPVFYVGLFAFCTYMNAGWMREIMCTHMCPYSRFQSVMFDNDTVTVTYDHKRGEGRGPRSKKLSASDYQQQGLGDCIDCNLCVQVCPTGIDIRNGLQYECINCGACVDACNGVMDKMGYAKDLIAFTSDNAINGTTSRRLKPKVIGYIGVLVLMLSALGAELVTRSPLDIDVIRDRSTLYRETLNGDIENVYTLVIMNKSQVVQQVAIKIEGLADSEVQGASTAKVPASQLIHHSIAVRVPAYRLDQAVTPFVITVVNEHGEQVSSESRFLSPH